MEIFSRNSSSTNFVVDKEEECQYIVQHLGSHMGDLTLCLKDIVQFKISMKDAVKARVMAPYSLLERVLVGESCGKVDPTTFVLTSHMVFESLATNEELPAEDIKEKFPKLLVKDIMDTFKRLVELNLTTFAGRYTILCLHSRKLKWTYETLKNTPFLKQAWEEAKTSYEKK